MSISDMCVQYGGYSDMNQIKVMNMTTIIFLISFVCVVHADFTFVLLHTNDVHARVEQTNKYHGNCSESDANANKCYGGAARRATVVSDIRRNYSNVILLDAGDEFQGTLWFNYYKGYEVSYFMDKMGYDVMVLGNHEFDNGISGLKPFIENASFPILSCNIKADPSLELQSRIMPYVILNISNQSIGVIGYTTKDTAFLVSPYSIQGIEFLDEVTSVRSQAAILKHAGVNKIIALGHSGLGPSKRVAKEVPDVDIVVDGHTNSFLYTGDPPSDEEQLGPYPEVVERAGGSKALVVQAYAYGKYLGFLDVTFTDAGDVKNWSGNPILLDGTYAQDPEILDEIEIWREPLLPFTQSVIGESLVVLQGGKPTCRLQECNMGNLVTDAVMDFHLKAPSANGWSNFSIVLWNGGGIRASLTQGDITRADVLTVLPFSNNVELVEVKGAVLIQILEHSVSDYKPEEPQGMFLQVAGLRVIYDLGKDVGSRVHEVYVRCTACDIPAYVSLDDEDTYAFLAADFLIQGGDGYSMIEPNILRREYYGNLASDVLISYLQKHSPVYPGMEGRITFRADAAPLTATTTLDSSQTITQTSALTSAPPVPLTCTASVPCTSPYLLPIFVMLTILKHHFY